MDIASHGLWGGIAFGRGNRRSFGLAFFFGILPDLVSFGPFYVAVFLGLAQRPRFGHEPPDPSLFPFYVHGAYSVTHSLVVFLVAFALLWAVFREPIWETFAWGLHILLDIFTHSYRFFPTPFLWPISHFKFDGWPWGMPAIFIPNVVLLALCYAWLLLRRRKVPDRSSRAFRQG
jgi:membrane-bound metal-dependent hydrolase YbcI (DUF457 family)